MATKTLVIEGTDRDHFFFSVESGTLRIGDIATHPEGVVRDMRVLRIRCEVEVEDDRESVQVDEPGVLAPSALRAGAAVKLAHAELSLAGETVLDMPALAAAVTPPPADDFLQLDLALGGGDSGPASSTTEAPAIVARRFKVIDGGDQGRSFMLPEDGTLSLGKPGHADIGLHDLYVSKVHCLIHIDGYKIMVSHVEGQTGTLIDGMRISVSQKLRSGSVLRIGNSHLKLEQGPFPDEPEPKAKEPEPPPPPKKRVRAEVVPEPPKDPLLSMEGQTFGNFKLGKLLGRGFAGAVYQAENAKTSQAVAVKILSAEFPASAAELDRFVHEFKAAQGVRHANLLAMHGAGKVGAHCWFARDLVEGESAAEVIRRAAESDKPSWTRAARVAIHLGRALQELEKRELVHANITPNNVLIAPATHATKLADLNLAQALAGSKLQQSFEERKRLAESPYFAPEVSDPEAFVDGLADLYSVGAVVYAMIAGKPPPATGKVPKPSSVYKKVPAEFDKVVMKLIAPKQEDRYQTAAELLDDMKPIGEENDLKL